MSEPARELYLRREPVSPSPVPAQPSLHSGLDSANEVVLAMARAAKGVRIYLPNNPVLINFLDELALKMGEHIARYGDLGLSVEPFALSYQGLPVYLNRDPKESIAFRMHADGIRRLLFSGGVERRELSLFIGIVSFEQTPERDDDVVTQLWERSLPHVSYLLEEDCLDAEWEEEEFASQQEALSRLLVELARAPSPLPPAIPETLLALNRHEERWLRQARQLEEQQDPLDEVIEVLSAIVAGSADDQIFGEFVGIAANLCVSLLQGYETAHALKLIRFLDRMPDSAQSPSGARRQVVRRAIDGILTEKTLQALHETVDGGESVGYRELKELLLIFGLPCLGQICDLLGRVEKLKMRKVIVEVLVELGTDRPEAFAPYLSDPRWFLVRNVVLVLSLLGTPAALEMIVALTSHKEQRIRKEVLGFLERSPQPKARTYILKYLRDPSSALRIRALQILARERLPFALKPALALTTADDFRSKELAEKVAVYEAIGELGADRVIFLFREMLQKKHWFKRNVEKEKVACAVAGLVKIASPAAVELLEEGARLQRNDELRALMVEAAAVITRGWGRGGSAAGEV